MGITRESYSSITKMARHAARLRSAGRATKYKTILSYFTYRSKYKLTSAELAKIVREKQEKLEEQLHEVQERIYMTRLYISRIRHEYEGSAREAIEHYVSVINQIYSRVSRHYLDNIRFNTPVSEDFLQEIEDEYMQLVLEGGFTEEEAFDYMYGSNTDAWNTDDESMTDDVDAAADDAVDATIDAADNIVEVTDVLGNMTL